MGICCSARATLDRVTRSATHGSGPDLCQVSAEVLGKRFVVRPEPRRQVSEKIFVERLVGDRLPVPLLDLVRHREPLVGPRPHHDVVETIRAPAERCVDRGAEIRGTNTVVYLEEATDPSEL